jgi:hypothetical protein
MVVSGRRSGWCLQILVTAPFRARLRFVGRGVLARACGLAVVKE